MKCKRQQRIIFEGNWHVMFIDLTQHTNATVHSKLCTICMLLINSYRYCGLQDLLELVPSSYLSWKWSETYRKNVAEYFIFCFGCISESFTSYVSFPVINCQQIQEKIKILFWFMYELLFITGTVNGLSSL